LKTVNKGLIMAQIAQDGEVGLVYRINGKSYAVALQKDQHLTLQVLVSALGKIHVDKTREVDFVSVKSSEL
jgi:ribosomal protein L21E